ncbi:MAG: hypothetical protein IJQ68_03745 [Methanobrevibacter sp.]|uniref:hypothetical protein n=1 Tax=Methanobrevibacter sp. TaxID=66852 RepID=UPI0025DC5BCB|nr:hypothetical protein [Methanobrevibacter sp.]MBR0271091.1 hypothetical protein [Methanobrevibacter sp.]
MNCEFFIGTSQTEFRNLNIPDNTEDITKEIFDKMIKDIFDSKKDAPIEIAKNFDFNLAIERNKSFKYFLEKLDRLTEK